MGDTGSLALGAVLGVIAVILKHEILLAIVGIVFVLETVSVMIQVLYFKKTGKRFLRWRRYTTTLSSWAGARSRLFIRSGR